MFIFTIVPLLVALPSHNGFQERTFSACTWFDNPLRQSLEDERFEKAVLLAVNECFIEGEVLTDEKAKEIVRKVVASVELDVDSS